MGLASMFSGWMNGWIGEWMDGSTKWALIKTITRIKKRQVNLIIIKSSNKFI